MNIAILTLPLNTNYGGILQAYALQTVLQRMGHNVEILQKIPSSGPLSWKMPLRIIKRLFTKFLYPKYIPQFIQNKIISAVEKPIIEQNITKFISKYLNLRKLESLYDLRKSDYQLIIVGSDQIWRKLYFQPMWKAPIPDAFLDFTKNWHIKRLSYAASFGKEDISEYTLDEIELCKRLINHFDAISVREDSGVDICLHNFNVKAIHVLDPTMLLNAEDYISLVKKSRVPKSNGNMLCYILDRNSFKEGIIQEISEKNKLIPFNVNAQLNDTTLPIEQRIQPSVESWLQGFIDAEYIVTDSFHACVFSIIFNKPFIVIGNKNRGISRIKSLLKSFDLQDRLVENPDDLDKLPQNLQISENSISDLRKMSLEFLQKNLIRP